MISYWCNEEHRSVIDSYLTNRGQPVARLVRVRTYGELSPVLEVARGAHIFAALDQLGPGGREAVIELCDYLKTQCPGDPVLNDPRIVRLRYDLLKKLFQEGINRFSAYRLSEPLDDVSYPVFVRDESRHDGALTGLLHDRAQLDRAVLALRARGYRSSDLLCVEYCDVSDEEGFYHKAGAFKVGEAILPAHLLKGRHWMLKWDASVRDETSLRAQVDYVAGNPHEAWVRHVFELAGIDFGRIDYGVSGDVLQAWEINTHPTIGWGTGPPPTPLTPRLEALLDEARTLHHRAMHNAVKRLDQEGRTRPLKVRLNPALIARAKLETARARGRKTRLGLMRRVYHSRVLGRFLRAAYGRLLPRM